VGDRYRRPVPSCVHVAEAFVVHPETGHVLVVHNPTSWSFPAGRVEEGETFAEAVVRETLEETTVSIEALGVLAVSERAPLTRTRVLFVTFATRYVDGVPSAGDDPEISKALWLPPDEAEQRVDFLPGPIATLLTAVPGVRYEAKAW